MANFRALIFLALTNSLAISASFRSAESVTDTITNPANGEVVVSADSISVDLLSGILEEISIKEDEMGDLVSLIFADESKKKREKQTTDIIAQIYSEEKTRLNKEIDVLNFLTSVYSEHGYEETGSWVKQPRSFQYLPYKGKLPEFKMSDFRNPMTGRVTSCYGYRPNYGRDHHGIDFALSIGDTVRVALPGVVTGIGHDPQGYGNYIIVSHSGDLQTLYGHLNSVMSNLGDVLKGGDAIAIGGCTGNSTGPHLHFETRLKGVPFNPVKWFDFSK